MFRANGTGDLQKGERSVCILIAAFSILMCRGNRYTNMDWIFLSSIVGTLALLLTISYDIACQWSVNFFERLKRVPSYLLPSSTIENIRFHVPKFHLPAHIKACHSPFSLSFTKGVGRTDGEGVERLWAFLNKIARSVSMMRWGGRQDTLDDFCNFSNWRKTVNLGISFKFDAFKDCSWFTGNSLLKKLSLAIPAAVIHHRAYVAFTDGIRSEHPGIIDQWETLVTDWESDPTRPCPYELPPANCE
jgi:hypothetical protein